MPSFLYHLPVCKLLDEHISICDYNELPVLVVKHPLVQAAISLQGAHLLSWQPTDQQPVIWLSENAVFRPGVAIRGGVPICWPWFGKEATPSHGFARIMMWELVEHSSTLLNVNVTLKLVANEQTKAIWPHDFTLLAHFKLGHDCEIELEAIGDFETTAALHSYFHVQNIQLAELSGLGGTYTDSLNNGQSVSEPSGKLLINGLVDRVYTQPEPISKIDDQILDRTIEVRHMYASDVVVWNPWQELSNAMDDMTDDGYETMVCIETARINNKLIAKPDQPAILKVTFHIEK